MFTLEVGLYHRPVSPAERAEVLLRRHLSPEQLADYARNGAFWVTGNVTCERYRIYATGGPNIAIRGKHAICVGPSYGLSLPTADRLLTQKLFLELDEGRLLMAINLTPAAVRDLCRFII